MIPGLRGHLIAEGYLEQNLDAGLLQVPAGFSRHGLTIARRRSLRLGPAASLRSVLEDGGEPLLAALGFSPPADTVSAAGALVSTVRGSSGPAAFVVAPWAERLDRYWRVAVVQARERSAAWALLFNGTQLRVVDASRIHSRRYTELDLDAAAADDRAFAALASVLHASAMALTLQTLIDGSDAYGTGVCRSLRSGVLAASADVLSALLTRASGTTVPHTFEQALTIVYRILFFLFAEARGLVPVWHPVYRDSYTVESLRAAAERSATTPGLWDALRAMARLAHAGCDAGTLQVTPFNGRLFSPARTPLAERRDLDDRAAGRALLALTTRPAADRAGLERIGYRDLGVEQLGAVYETLLDYEPRVTRDERRGCPPRVHVSLERGSGLRKATGTFYTPQPIADYLVRRVLGPLVRDAAPVRILELKVLDPAMGSGAFLVSACRFLADAYQDALLRTGGCHASDLGPAEHASIRRTIAERCLFGVDVNPMAVQLARLSLWLATLAADRPLTFLDHHLATGDSTLGAWLSSLRLPPSPARRRRAAGAVPLFDEAALGGALRAAVPMRFTLGHGPSDSRDDVRRKERVLARLNRDDGALARWKAIADVWCAMWFSSPSELPAAAFGELSDALLAGTSTIPRSTRDRFLEAARRIARVQRFFHWELEFPEVFFDEDGRRSSAAGFDAILGNPPWDMMRADAGSAETRDASRAALAATVRFTRDSGTYRAQAHGHPNRYQLFVERGVSLARPGGRIGFVLPAGMFAAEGSAPLRRLLFTGCDVDAIIGFDNRDGVFPIHRSTRFTLTTATIGRPTREIGCRLGERSTAGLDTDHSDDRSSRWFTVRVTPALLERVSGDDLALPEWRTPTDVAIHERAVTLFRPLGDDGGWGARFGRELNATDDRRRLRLAGDGLPVVEGKQINPFRVDVRRSRAAIRPRDATDAIGDRWQHARLAYRDVASPTNRLTLIAAILPAGCASTHTVYCLRRRLPRDVQDFLCGCFNSLMLNYLVRLRVITHVTTGIVERLPVPDRQQAGSTFDEVAAAARVLARRFDPHLWAVLNAQVARLYQLSNDELAHVLSTFPLIDRGERDEVAAAFGTLAVS